MFATMTEEQKTTANKRISAACPVLGRMPTKSTEHMGQDEREAVIGQMLADLYTLAVNDGCIAAGWAYEFAGETAEKSPKALAVRDSLLAALIELYDATTDRGWDKIKIARATARRAMGQAEPPQQQ